MCESEVNIRKRKKSSPFSKEDEIRLLNAIFLERKIIENKETNKFSNMEKDKAWSRVVVAYNANGREFRNVDQLKAKFDNLKTKTRKIVAQERIHLKGTGGGGPLFPDPDPIIELVLKIINWKTVVGLENEFDSDNIAGDIGVFSRVEENQEELESEIIYDRTINDDNNEPMILNFDDDVQTNQKADVIVLASCSSQSSVHCQPTPLKEIIDNNNENAEVATMKKTPKASKHVWDNYTPKNLKQPISKKLRPSTINPVSVAKELYYKKKAMFVEQETRFWAEQDKREGETHELKKELLQLEILLKKNELKKF